ncbi:hypothetical protein HY732_00035 [Candidatus Uhrbacteria bacterium]|nr:hypothetical protein [Candidatus Uhrbacteria bacterium]
MIIHVSRQFEKQYKRIPENIRQQAQAKEALFRTDPFHPLLRTHKLKGKRKGGLGILDQLLLSHYIPLSCRERGALLRNWHAHEIYR